MIVKNAKPPNYDKIYQAFGPFPLGVMFCYGNTVYYPGGEDISPELHAHEQVHCDQQGDDVEGWWDKYIEDAQFRLDQEIPAHQAEYEFFLRTDRTRPERRRVLKFLAQRLSSKLYGRLLTERDASRIIHGKVF